MSTEKLMERERWATEEAMLRGNFEAYSEVFAADAVFHVPLLGI